MKKSKKCCILASICTIFGLAFLAVGVAMPLIISKALKTVVPESAALTEENSESWTETPGKYDISIIYSTYVYNCTNVEEVIYSGVKPTFTELGPYNYREYTEFTNRRYMKQQVPWSAEPLERVSPILP